MDEFRKSSHRYLLTYGSSGRSLTHEMFQIQSKVEVDECYTLTQRDLKYTLVHIKNRAVRSTMTSMMCKFDEMFNIKAANVFGYPYVSLGNEIDEHPGMKMIIENVKKNANALECWTSDGDIRKYKRGLLYPYLPGFDVQDMTKAQLVNHVKELNEKIRDDETRLATLETLPVENDELRRENKRLKRRMEIQEMLFIQGGRASELLPPSP